MKNLVKLYDKTTTQERSLGRVWYWDAHEFCEFTARKYSLSMPQVCGIVSALSPACSWASNKAQTIGLIESYLEEYETEPFKFTTYGSNVVKATRIYQGEDPGTLFSMKTGAKTYNFYWNLKEPNNPDYVTIDRHALTAVGSTQTYQLTKSQYLAIAQQFQTGAKKVGLLPNQFQAILWLHIKNN